MVTKLPDSGQTPPPVEGVKNLRPPAAAATVRADPAPSQLSPAQQLDMLQLQNRETVLARVAQVLNSAQGQAAEAVLDIRGRSLLIQPAVGETPLAQGDWVKVMRAGNELQLLGKLAGAPEARIAQALAQRLPWQQRLDTGLAQLVNALGAATGSAPGSFAGRAPLPTAVTEAIQQLVSQLPSGKSLTTALPPGAATGPAASTAPGADPEALVARIKAWISDSGNFAESRVARAADMPLADLKLALGRIVASLLAQQGGDAGQFNRYTPLVSHELVQAPLQFPNPLPSPPPVTGREPMEAGQMLRLLAGMLNRISVNQLHSQALTNRVTAEGPAPATWLVELPWVNPQGEPRLAQLRLEHDRAGEEGGKSRRAPAVAEWRFSLALDLDDSGSVFFEVSLRDVQVSARVWAEQQDTLKRVQEELTGLRTRLSDLGLDVVDLECRRGTPQGSATRLEQRLVDTRA
ncbi:MAG: flagellar hook-length control protein FliK [Marinobacter sp.]|uniref:flagellar hook-length control protein FliK n=1 Tax=Marinobacter sp. TaxID=50741 RepID=UPI00299EB0B4|nr:flagellar hook-length control protein FliK [Marinobacter sp.]MDX1635836.1 flagellar hook-length control protein FliK [Marinobacter sp.]